MLFIILHRVRGEPAFDIALRLDTGTPSDPGPWWIIPTSGHRAYPSQWWHLPEQVLDEASPLPDDLEDHYHADIDRSATRAPSGEGAALLKELGLCEPSKQLSLNLPSTGITLKPSPK